MMSWRWLLWLIPLYLIALIALTPASVIKWGAGLAPEQGLHVSSTAGTIWNGRANISAKLPTGGMLNLDDVQWQLNPWKLFMAEAEIAVEIPSKNYLYGTAVINAGMSQAQLKGNLKGAMQPAIQQLKLPVPITMAGNFELDITDYQVSDFNSGKICDALAGTINARRTEMRINQQWYELGDYLATLTCNAENGINVRIDDNNIVGLRLDAQVNGRIDAPQLSVNGSMKPTLQTPQPISELLVFIGKPDAQGRYNFKW
ncbi:type II secretion system protein N [Pseudidiomarina marina]|uniref:type II secretion system protein N n=1 Tax=Pseudidiomarina marina TaxID=502366 RepID=UPI003850AEA4